MKTCFWLLDINYELRDKEPQIWLWGIDDKENRVLVIDKNFSPYFYIVPEKKEQAQAIIEEIRKQKTSFQQITRLQVEEKTFFGKPVTAIKVECGNPDVILDYVKRIQNVKGVKECLEDDIRYSMQYLIDNELAPCGWHEIEVEETANAFGVQTDKVYAAKVAPKHNLERHHVPKLRILGFSFACYSEKGSPKPDKNPIVIMSVITNAGEEKQFVAEDNNDKTLLQGFIDYVRGFDPDIIVGYETNKGGWTYLIERFHKHGLKLAVDRANTEPHTSVYGHVSATGRINLDLHDFADEFGDVKVKTLENVADYLGVMSLEKRTLIEEVDVPVFWKTAEKRSTLLKYSWENARSVLGVANVIIDFAMQLSNLVSLPLDHVGTAAVGFRIEWFLIRQARKIGELVPRRVERPYVSYAGGIVLAPKAGIHENVAVLDFKSMYPALMIAYNVSPDTYLSKEEAETVKDAYTAPEVGHMFRRQPPGFYKSALSQLIAIRDQIKTRLRTLKPENSEYRVLDARQKAVKVITNAAYGYAGWIGARWYLKPVAEAAAAWGRQTINQTIRLADKNGLQVIYGDTDSIFIKYDKDGVEKLARDVNATIGLEIKPDKIYTRILFTEAKKRYAGLLPDGKLDVVGLEVVRGDWAEVAKKAQEKVLEIILKENSLRKAVMFVQQLIADLGQKKVPFRDLVVWKTLTKSPEDYAVRTPHVEAAKYLLREGWSLDVGDKVGYVVTVGAGKLYQKVKPAMLAFYDEIDFEYYIGNQILPAVLRILEMFGVKEEDLLKPNASHAPSASKTLADFMKS